MRAIVVPLAILAVSAVGCAESSNGDASGEASPQTTMAAEPADTGAESMLACESESGTLRVDGEAYGGSEYPWGDLTNVSLDVDDDQIAVTWETAGAIPSTIVSPGGANQSILYSVIFTGADEFLASLDVRLNGSEWNVSTRDWVTNEVSQVATTPSASGSTLTASFPRAAIPAEADAWWALVEGDGDPDPEFGDVELFYMVQDTCPAADSFVVPRELRLPF
jgi:hypothetical protein